MWHPRGVTDSEDPTGSSAHADSSDDKAPQQTILDQLGGLSGLVYSTLPVIVFVPANSLFDLTVAIWTAVAVAVGVLVWRLVQKAPIQPAISGFFGVVLCAFIAYRTGDAKGYFLFGIYISLVYAAVFIVSIAVRWPLVGVLWGYLNGKGTTWRSQRGSVKYYDIATFAWALVFGARYLVQSELYDSDQTGWLAVARIGMGWPLTAIVLLLNVWAVRRADKVLQDVAATTPEGPDTPDVSR